MIFLQRAAKHAALLGEQDVHADKHYRPLLYCSFVEIDGKTVVTNRLTGSILLPGEEELSLLQNGADGSDPQAQALIRDWFLVPEDHDDYGLLTEIRGLVEVLLPPKKGIKKYVVMTTTDCNARCFYCYQMGRLARTHMTTETASAVASYIERTAAEDDVEIEWFGGEPLYNMTVIDVICAQLKKSGVRFYSTMTSNAYLFTEEVQQKAIADWNLKSIVIALDGTEAVYNRIKAYIYKDGESPFLRVLSNIEHALAAGIGVAVRINLDKHNTEDLYALVDMLIARFGAHPRFYMGSDVVFDTENRKTKKDIEEQHRLLDALEALDVYCMQHGLRFSARYKGMLRMNCCQADTDQTVTISPEGRLGPCNHFIETDAYGTVTCDTVDTQMLSAWKEQINNRARCGDCPNAADCIRLVRCTDGVNSLACDSVYKRKQMHLHAVGVETVCRARLAELEKKQKEE